MLFTNYMEVELPPIESTVEVKPETLNLAGKGDFTVFIQLPEGYDISEVDIGTVECEGAVATRGNVAKNKLIVKFDRESLVDVEPGDEVTFTVTGILLDGTRFIGLDTIRVID